jgi:HK97 family phage major capsid protein
VSATLKELRGRMAERQEKLARIFEQAGPDYDMAKVTELEGDSAGKVEQIQSINAEMDAIAEESAPLEALETIDLRQRRLAETQPHPGHQLPGDGRTAPGGHAKSLAKLIVESDAYTGYKAGQGVGPVATVGDDLPVMATLFETAAGWTPETTRTGRVVEFATRPVQVTDIVPQTVTTQAAVVYMEETTFTNAAAETAEGGTYQEAALALTERQSAVKKVAVWLPATDEQLEDVPQAEGYINNRLPFMLRQRLDGQILVGSGAGANLRGFLNVVGIQTQAKGADPVPDAIYKALVKVRVTGRAFPNAVILHPNDWQDIRLLRTADGIYIWGNPSEAGPERIWGLGVVQSDAETEHTGLVGDFANFTELAVRRGIDVQITNAHADFFINGKQAVRADMRAALIAYRPAALCTVTGI